MTHVSFLPSVLVATLTALGATGLAQAQPADEFNKAIQEGDRAVQGGRQEPRRRHHPGRGGGRIPQKLQDFDALDTAKAGKLTLEQILTPMKKDWQARRDTKK